MPNVANNNATVFEQIEDKFAALMPEADKLHEVSSAKIADKLSAIGAFRELRDIHSKLEEVMAALATQIEPFLNDHLSGSPRLEAVG